MDRELLLNACVQACVLQFNLPTLVGISGGTDSLCMLDAMFQLGFPLVVAHLDHGLREGSAAEAQQVRAEAEARGLPFVTESADVAAYASHEGLSTEEAARILRYRFLFAQAQARGAQAVAVAHTADDQVETVLMHLLRGSGLDGLKGMVQRSLMTEWSADIPLVRPLLGFWREETEAYCRENSLNPIQDPSNADIRIHRNRLRHELIPHLETYNPRMKEAIWRMAATLQGDDETLRAASHKALQGMKRVEGLGFLALDRQEFARAGRGMQRRILRDAISSLRKTMCDIGFDVVERAIQFGTLARSSGQVDLIAGLKLEIQDNQLWLIDESVRIKVPGWPQVENCMQLEAGDGCVPGSINLGNDWVLILEFPAEKPREWEENPHAAWLDADALTFPLTVRARRPGDRFSPLGMEGHSLKVSDLMINKKLPRRARVHWPLVCSGDRIAWIPGFRAAQSFAVTEKTRRFAYLELVNRPTAGAVSG